MKTPLIAILRDHLDQTPTSPFNTDWGELLALSKKHEVTAIVYAQCKSFIPQAYIEEYRRAWSAILFYYTNRVKMMEKIEAALADIEHFMIKGPSVAQYYPFPAFRTMGDTDIVIHTEDRTEADRRLRELGLACLSSFVDREWQYCYHNMEVELHDHLVYTESVNVDAQERFFNDFWKHVQNNELDWDFHFLFLILHLRKHFMNSGIGLRQFMDIAVLCSRGPNLNWSWIEDNLKELHLWTFAERVFSLNECWFGIAPPVMIDPPSQDFIPSATDLILKNGIFGFDNEDNYSNEAVNAIRGKANRKGAMLKRTMQKLFPDHECLSKDQNYPYLRERPYLLPVAWVHRMCRSIIHRRVMKNIRVVIKGSFTDQDTIRRREAIYEQWGL